MSSLVFRNDVRTVLSLTALALAMGTHGLAHAKGGTAKPPTKGVVAPFVPATLPDPMFSVNPLLIDGFDITGFIQDATLSDDNSNCPGVTDSNYFGGTLTVNGTQIIVPHNSHPDAGQHADLGGLYQRRRLAGPERRTLSVVRGAGGRQHRRYEAGRRADLRVAAVAQQRQRCHYPDRLHHRQHRGDNGDPPHRTVLQINDPNGRFGRAQSPDPRFSVDDANPTIHAGTGYPMCVPRTDPAVIDDPLCPRKNRPAPPCRLFSNAGVAPPASGEPTPAPFGKPYCSQCVMKATPGTPGVLAANTAGRPIRIPASKCRSRLETSSLGRGTLFKAPSGGGDFISVNTIEANLGIYTQPGTQPSYLAIGEFGIGTADPLATAVNGAAQ